MAVPIEYASFLVRLWREAEVEAAAPAADWHGEVEHIQSGQHWSFSALEEVLDFLWRQAEDPGVLSSSVGEQARSSELNREGGIDGTVHCGSQIAGYGDSG